MIWPPGFTETDPTLSSNTRTRIVETAAASTRDLTLSGTLTTGWSALKPGSVTEQSAQLLHAVQSWGEERVMMTVMVLL